MIKRALANPAVFFLLVCVWKIALWAVFALPVPSNDAFFYDGPVVNYLLHGKYANPALALALPISGTEIFSAYPPLYQGVLLSWMTFFGTSAFSAMGLHVALFCIYAWLLFLVLKRLKTPLPGMHLAAGFLLLITFTDRPDSLAHVLGFAALFCWVRGSRAVTRDSDGPANPVWFWLMAAFAILSIATGLQIGALYCAVLFVGIVFARIFTQERLPVFPFASMVVVPLVLVVLVRIGLPRAWAGFVEHAGQTPSFTGLRFPRPDEILKLLRTVPGLLASPLLLLWVAKLQCSFGTEPGHLARPARTPQQPAPELPNPPRPLPHVDDQEASSLNAAYKNVRAPDARLIVTLAAMLPALAMLGAAMFVLTANSVLFTLNLQPLIVGGAVALCVQCAPVRLFRVGVALLLGLMVLGSIRAVGLTTWGVACALDLSYRGAAGIVHSELSRVPPGTKVVLSSAYLYEAERVPGIEAIHSDWMQRADVAPDADWRAFTKVRPAKLVLTQFDFFRRYQPLLEELNKKPELGTFTFTNAAHVPAPDSFPPLRRVLQHVSWAPVVVSVDWR